MKEALNWRCPDLNSDFKIMVTEASQFKTSEAAFAVNRQGRIVAWNKAAVTAFGFPRSNAMNQRCWELLSGQDIFGNPYCCEVCPIRTAAFSNAPVKQFKINFSTSDQSRRQFTVSSLMLFNGPGKNAFVHLCHPEADASEGIVRQQALPDSRRKLLTRRETEVLVLMHKGMTISEIADEMSVSVFTIRNHCHHIFSKLRVHSRFEAVATGRKLHLI